MKVSELKSKRFKVLVGGEVERTTNFKCVEKLLHNWADYESYTAKERKSFWATSARRGCIYVDANITCQAIGN